MCEKEMSEWTEDDDPFKIHWEKCRKSCAWANVRCGLKEDMDRNGRYAFRHCMFITLELTLFSYVFKDKNRVPTSKAMEKSRLETFTDWPYDGVKDHKATSKNVSSSIKHPSLI